MKLLVKIIALTSLTAGLGLYFVPTRGISFPSNEIQSTKQQANTVPVALPLDATVIRKKGSKLSGKITDIDQTQSAITLARGEKSEKVAVADIDKVEFGKEVKFIHSGKLIFRGGENNPSPNASLTWQEPLAHFKITNSQDGHAEVTLTNVSQAKLDGIRAVAETNTYVVDELSFNDSHNTIILKVIPYSE